MVSDALSVESAAEGGLFSRISDTPTYPTLSDEHDELDFRDTWSELMDTAVKVRYSADTQERLQHDLLLKTIAITYEYPEYINVHSYTFDEHEDMTVHTETHFDSLFNNDTFAPRFKLPTRDAYSTLMKSAEIVYIDDAVLRFVKVWEFEPALEELNTLRITESHPGLAQWMEKMQILWDTYAGDVDLGKSETIGLVETLYGSRYEFVTTAKKMDMFLPIPPRQVSGGSPNFLEMFKRGNEIKPSNIHREVYKKIIDEF